MGYIKAKHLRRQQEVAEYVIERRITKLRAMLEKMEKHLWEVRHADWGAEEERRI